MGTIRIINSVVAGNANGNGADVLTLATGTTVDVKFSAIGSPAGFTPSPASLNNLPVGTDLKLTPLALVGGPTRAFAPSFGSPLIDAGSNLLSPAGITTDQRGGSFARTVGAAVDIGSIESQAPFLPIAVATAAPVTTTGETSYQFTVTYSDSQGPSGAMETAGIVGNHTAVRVTGPNGFDQSATYLSIDDPTDGTPRTATYTFTPPGGSWDGADNGTYVVRVQGNQVADTIGTSSRPRRRDLRRPLCMVTTLADAGLKLARRPTRRTPRRDRIRSSSTRPSLARPSRSLLSAQIDRRGRGVDDRGPGRTLPARPAARTSDLLSMASTLTLSGLTVTGQVNGRAGLTRGPDRHPGARQFTAIRPQRAGGSSGVRRDVPLLEQHAHRNTATGSGGAMYLDAQSVIENSRISGNSAVGKGGGMYLFGSGSSPAPGFGFDPNATIIRSSTIADNSAGGRGGGIAYYSQRHLIVRDSTVSGNTSAIEGGGIGGRYGPVTVLNSTISGNTAGTAATPTASGGGVFIGFSGYEVLRVLDSTVIENTAFGTQAQSGGGGIAMRMVSGRIEVRNSVVSGNTNANAPDILAVPLGQFVEVNVNYSAVGRPPASSDAREREQPPFGTDPSSGRWPERRADSDPRPVAREPAHRRRVGPPDPGRCNHRPTGRTVRPHCRNGGRWGS